MPKGIGYGKKTLKRKTRHSPAGEEYRKYGKTKGLVELYKSRQSLHRLKKQAAEGDKPKVYTVGKVSSGPLDFEPWRKKYGYGNTPAVHRQHRAYLRNFGK